MAQRTPLPPAGPGQAAVEVVGGSFAWARSDAPLLHDVNLAGGHRLPERSRAFALRVGGTRPSNVLRAGERHTCRPHLHPV